MISDVLRLAVVWVFAIVGIVIVVMGIVKSETHKLEPTNLVLTIFLIILSVNYTIEFLRKLK